MNHLQNWKGWEKSGDLREGIANNVPDDTSDPDKTKSKCPGSGSTVALLVHGDIVLSTRYGKVRVFINKTLSTETDYQKELINRDLLSTRFDN